VKAFYAALKDTAHELGLGNMLDQIWRSPAFPMWLTLAAAGFFGIVVLITLSRADKSVANGALTVITLLAIGVAVAAAIRGSGPVPGGASAETRSPPAMNAALPALSCVDDLAGDTVLTACEKVLFGSAESAAAAVSYAASRLTQLTSFGDVAVADKKMTPELRALRGAIEHDRYGLVAYVLLARDHCTPSECAAFGALTDHNRIVANMEQRTYEELILRYASTWNAPVATGATVGALAAFPPSVPTGRPTNADFPSAASTPAVSIMNPEPGSKGAPPAPRAAAAAAANAPLPPPRATQQATTPTLAAKKPASKPHAVAPVQIAPVSPAAPAAPATAPAASND
jgi:hypothetical protein